MVAHLEPEILLAAEVLAVEDEFQKKCLRKIVQKVFMDTWGWISLYNKREKKHEEVKNWYRSFRKQHGIIYTTDYVLDETFTLLFRRTPFDLAAFEKSLIL